jgi:chromosome segregation ATPase
VTKERSQKQYQEEIQYLKEHASKVEKTLKKEAEEVQQSLLENLEKKRAKIKTLANQVSSMETKYRNSQEEADSLKKELFELNCSYKNNFDKNSNLQFENNKLKTEM